MLSNALRTLNFDHLLSFCVSDDANPAYGRVALGLPIFKYDV